MKAAIDGSPIAVGAFVVSERFARDGFWLAGVVTKIVVVMDDFRAKIPRRRRTDPMGEWTANLRDLTLQDGPKSSGRKGSVARRRA